MQFGCHQASLVPLVLGFCSGMECGEVYSEKVEYCEGFDGLITTWLFGAVARSSSKVQVWCRGWHGLARVCSSFWLGSKQLHVAWLGPGGGFVASGRLAASVRVECDKRSYHKCNGADKCSGKASAAVLETIQAKCSGVAISLVQWCWQ
ncbi:hypothetical protein U1Q18_007448 [Sarracenia purpurea var. burkii]